MYGCGNWCLVTQNISVILWRSVWWR